MASKVEAWNSNGNVSVTERKPPVTSDNIHLCFMFISSRFNRTRLWVRG